MAAILLALVQAVAAPIPLDGTILGEWSLEPAEAVLYSPDTKVPRSAEVALRRAIPAVNPSMKKMQVRVVLFFMSIFLGSLSLLLAKQFSHSRLVSALSCAATKPFFLALSQSNQIIIQGIS
jgi:hypothetical protein